MSNRIRKAWGKDSFRGTGTRSRRGDRERVAWTGTTVLPWAASRGKTLSLVLALLWALAILAMPAAVRGSGIDVDQDDPAPDGPVLWLDARRMPGVRDGDLVMRWRDRSGHGNDAVQPDPQHAPVRLRNQLNGRPVVRFGGDALEMYLTVPYGFDPGTNVTIIGVIWPFQPAGWPGAAGVLDTAPSAPNSLSDEGTDWRWQTAFTVPMNRPTRPLVFDLSAALDPDRHIVYRENDVLIADARQAGELNGPVNWRGWDGGLTNGIALPNVGPSIGVLNLAFDFPYKAFFEGDIGVLMIYDRVLDPAERSAVVRRLMRQWGIR